MVFHWRIFLLSRANRLYSIFLHWLEEPGVLLVSDILLSSTWNTGFDSSARYESCQTTAILLFTSAEGKGSPLPFWGPSQSFGFSLLPLGVRWPEVTKYQHLLISPLWPTFFLKGHFFWRLDTVNSKREDSINLISIVSVGYHVTICWRISTISRSENQPFLVIVQTCGLWFEWLVCSLLMYLKEESFVYLREE